MPDLPPRSEPSHPLSQDGTDPGRPFDLQGHRGARGLLPENSIPSFLRAIDIGVSTLELDVVITGDSEVLVSHEPWMRSDICSQPSGEPVQNRSRRLHNIYEMSMEEIAAYDCGRRHPRFPRQKTLPVTKPLLRDVIRAADEHTTAHGLAPVHFNIEAKSSSRWDGRFQPEPKTFVRLIYEVVTKTDVVERTILQSFDVRILRAAKKLDAPWRLAFLIRHAFLTSLAGQLRRLGFTPDIYAPHYRLVTPKIIRQAQARGMQVIPWTVNTSREMRHLYDLGVDGLITDYPDVAMLVLKGTPPEQFSETATLAGERP